MEGPELDPAVSEAIGVLISARASVDAAITLLRRANSQSVPPPTPDSSSLDGPCQHPKTRKIATQGDTPDAHICVMCGEQVDG